MPTIDRHDGVSPKEGLHEDGDVEFAAPVDKEHRIETDKHSRAAWSDIHHEDNATKYDHEEVKRIKERIKRAAKKHDIEIEAD